MRASVFTFVMALVPLAAHAADPVHRLSLGDAGRRDKDVALVLDAGIDTATGETVGPDDLAARLDKTRLVLLGESHTSVESHRVQLHVLRALARRGRHIRIGLEMFPYTEQASLDVWNAGRWTETEFVDKARWYEHWGYHWGYYRDVLLFARAQAIPIFAINARASWWRPCARPASRVCRPSRRNGCRPEWIRKAPTISPSSRRKSAAVTRCTAG